MDRMDCLISYHCLCFTLHYEISSENFGLAERYVANSNKILEGKFITKGVMNTFIQDWRYISINIHVYEAVEASINKHTSVRGSGGKYQQTYKCTRQWR